MGRTEEVAEGAGTFITKLTWRNAEATGAPRTMRGAPVRKPY
ncbi:hypothetical protein [Streptomyces lunaelactis]|nr:hypothetical protein [Streptomyces lunaelactis]